MFFISLFLFLSFYGYATEFLNPSEEDNRAKEESIITTKVSDDGKKDVGFQEKIEKIKMLRDKIYSVERDILKEKNEKLIKQSEELQQKYQKLSFELVQSSQKQKVKEFLKQDFKNSQKLNKQILRLSDEIKDIQINIKNQVRTVSVIKQQRQQGEEKIKRIKDDIQRKLKSKVLKKHSDLIEELEKGVMPIQDQYLSGDLKKLIEGINRNHEKIEQIQIEISSGNEEYIKDKSQIEVLKEQENKIKQELEGFKKTQETRDRLNSITVSAIVQQTGLDEVGLQFSQQIFSEEYLKKSIRKQKEKLGQIKKDLLADRSFKDLEEGNYPEEALVIRNDLNDKEERINNILQNLSNNQTITDQEIKQLMTIKSFLSAAEDKSTFELVQKYENNGITPLSITQKEEDAWVNLWKFRTSLKYGVYPNINSLIKETKKKRDLIGREPKSERKESRIKKIDKHLEHLNDTKTSYLEEQVLYRPDYDLLPHIEAQQMNTNEILEEAYLEIVQKDYMKQLESELLEDLDQNKNLKDISDVQKRILVKAVIEDSDLLGGFGVSEIKKNIKDIFKEQGLTFNNKDELDDDFKKLNWIDDGDQLKKIKRGFLFLDDVGYEGIIPVLNKLKTEENYQISVFYTPYEGHRTSLNIIKSGQDYIIKYFDSNPLGTEAAKLHTENQMKGIVDHIKKINSGKDPVLVPTPSIHNQQGPLCTIHAILHVAYSLQKDDEEVLQKDDKGEYIVEEKSIKNQIRNAYKIYIERVLLSDSREDRVASLLIPDLNEELLLSAIENDNKMKIVEKAKAEIKQIEYNSEESYLMGQHMLKIRKDLLISFDDATEQNNIQKKDKIEKSLTILDNLVDVVVENLDVAQKRKYLEKEHELENFWRENGDRVKWLKIQMPELAEDNTDLSSNDKLDKTSALSESYFGNKYSKAMRLKENERMNNNTSEKYGAARYPLLLIESEY